ncbi:MAG: hypothetical protein EBS05_25975 [Proteobacteria bacterium]|nr:hypothetical protein [Pseudomonadota bacterium]
MNTNKLRQHAEAVANFDNNLEQSAGIHASDLLLAMIDAGAAETPNGNYKFATFDDYKVARAAWVESYGIQRGWTPADETRNPGDNRFSSLGGTNFNPRTGDPTPEERAQAEAEDSAAQAIKDELKARKAELRKAFDRAIANEQRDEMHRISDELFNLVQATK